MLTRMAKESGIDTPSAEDLARFDRKRKGKTLSNADWKSPTDRDARIAKMKDGTTHLAYKPEHAVDLDTGVVVAAPIHLADEGDTTTLSPTLAAAARNLDAVEHAPSETILRRGRRQGLSFARTIGGSGRRPVEDAHRRTRAVQGLPALAWRRGGAQSGLRQSCAAEIGYRARDDAPARRNVKRSFAHVLDRGGMRRAWLRGRENLHKRYLIHVAGFNLGVLMRALYGQGTPREAAEAVSALIFVLQSDAALAFGLIATVNGELAAIVILATDLTRN